MGKPKKQFSRSTIMLDTVRRAWKQTPAHDIVVGDTVVGVGKIEAVKDTDGFIILTNVFGDEKTFHSSETVHAFVEA